LAQVLGQLRPFVDDNILIGPGTSDDVGVYRISADQALVMTTDFFPPVVDDPFAYGAIAVANALSDMYAKGVRPIAALNIVCFPIKTQPKGLLARILEGGWEKAREAGVPIIGGHSIDDAEPKYGLAVVGVADPRSIIANATARPGDQLVLTKPLGIGIITTGIKRGVADEATAAAAVHSMSALNAGGSDAMVRVGVNAATDVTGFGLLGHLHEMTAASRVGARIFASRVPVLSKAREMAGRDILPGGTVSNHQFARRFTRYDQVIGTVDQLVLCDAQTSGGLLISVAADRCQLLLEELTRARTLAAAVIGEIVDDAEGRIEVLA
ncbi:MAG: selenide, water dikinase SelD, partial [Acidobacteria bacterium]|nr:selenide, water dikinase SelD [Acidobacteriota bacterium]